MILARDEQSGQKFLATSQYSPPSGRFDSQEINRQKTALETLSCWGNRCCVRPDESLIMPFSKNDQRRVLLIDHDSRRQHLRVVALRNGEVEVHLASSINEAARLWPRHSYDLVLLAAEENSEEATLLSNELKKASPDSALPYSWERRST